ncbi:hypothetical protein PINS_up003776 [Pythium insidiosum]|nr:hypothetical protein PINS_up003776 [Pythium insidiosum]
MERLQTDLVCLATGSDGDMVVLQLYQRMAEVLDEVLQEQVKEEQCERPATASPSCAPAPLVLGRRAIYFHHIIAPTKRRVVKEWALELGLCGFSKIGWPGVVLVEGDERLVQEYVRRLQHLRWKQMVVRGEETIELSGDSSALEAARRLPRGFVEFPESAMSEAAALCRDVGVEELFLSVMKIYRSSDAERAPAEKREEETNVRDAGRKRDKGKQQRPSKR